MSFANWEQERKSREQDREKVIRDWERRTRHEKIRLLKNIEITLPTPEKPENFDRKIRISLWS